MSIQKKSENTKVRGNDLVGRTNRLNVEVLRARPALRNRDKPKLSEEHSGGVCPKNGEGVYNWTF